MPPLTWQWAVTLHGSPGGRGVGWLIPMVPGMARRSNDHFVRGGQGGKRPWLPTLGAPRVSPVPESVIRPQTGEESLFWRAVLAGEPKVQLTLKFFLWKWKLLRVVPLHSVRWGKE